MNFDLEQYLTDGIEQLVKDALRVTLRNPKQSGFFLRFAAASQKAAKRRHDFEEAGEHIPSFLIASITDNCNLDCAGCYARANNTSAVELPVSTWERIFAEAEELGISVILLAGGEPLLRRDVLEAAARRPKILFPVVTNGTLLDDPALYLFDTCRNLVPVVSIEGDAAITDSRRGQGIYIQAREAMARLRERGLLFGASITVTAANLDTVTDGLFMDKLERSGCKVALFVEYVPVDKAVLPLDNKGQATLAVRVNDLRARQRGMIIISFPGDEAESGGCLAAGRGFFHINASGGAEPCPFSPYSDLNLKDTSLREALKSPLFTRLREEGILDAKHTGGCVLFEQKEIVAKLATNDATT
ncbi:MAG: radical SAM protein [Clostridiales bacterium]|nr:radical SAM protein [Clostridiales bacterium]